MIQPVKINQNDNERLAEKLNEIIQVVNDLKGWVDEILKRLPGGPGFG